VEVERNRNFLYKYIDKGLLTSINMRKSKTTSDTMNRCQSCCDSHVLVTVTGSHLEL